jgi:hypothetical protein
MNQSLTISENLYNRLLLESQSRGLSIGQLVERIVEEWERRESELRQRQEAVREIRELRERIFAEHGEMPDSVELLREDRNR